jgi:hypothetical protein
MIRQSGRGADTLTPRQACNVAFSFLTEGANEEKRAEILNELNAEDDPWEHYAALFDQSHR